MNYPRRPTILLFALWLLSHAGLCVAIDNPDVPDYVAQFQARCSKFESKLREQAVSDREIAATYSEYERFLDQELNHAYSALIGRVDAKVKPGLVQSQRRWLEYRDAEFKFIAANWTVERFGTSSVISRGGYRTSLLKDRTVALLSYLKNYPPKTK